MRAAHSKFESPHGDIHQLLKIIGAYSEYRDYLAFNDAQSSEKLNLYCKAYFLNQKSMDEIYQLSR